jgi:uncharacterized membrane protein
MKRQSLALLLAFMVSFLAVGVPYWRLPYASVSLPSTLYGFGLVVVFLASAACRLVPSVRLLSAFAVVGAAVPAVIAVRVIYETTADPTSHNLWPFEIVIAAMLGFSISFVGSLLGGLLAPVVATK